MMATSRKALVLSMVRLLVETSHSPQASLHQQLRSATLHLLVVLEARRQAQLHRQLVLCQ